ncbi:MAG: hypothetical protein GY769_08085 [bacterium]|nr:hypothetical protein [bacterium]
MGGEGGDIERGLFAVAEAIDKLRKAYPVKSSFVSGQEDRVLNIVDTTGQIGGAIEGLARSVRDLGNGDACTPMGAIEAHGKVHKEGLEGLAEAIEGAGHTIGASIEGGFGELAKAFENGLRYIYEGKR